MQLAKNQDLIEVKIDRKTAFLNILKGKTKSSYSNGLNQCELYLRTLPEFKGSSNPLFEFIRQVKIDRDRDPIEMLFVERNTITGLFKYLSDQGYVAKSQLLIVSSLQSFGKFCQVPLSTKYTDAPDSIAVNEKAEWTLQELGAFVESMDSSLFQSVAVTALQSLLRPSDFIGANLPYSIIKKEFEDGIIPVCIPIKNSEKTLVRHRTFLGALAVKKLKKYFSEFGTPKPDEPVYDFSERIVENYFSSHAAKLYPKWAGQNPYCPYSIRGSACTFLSDALCPESAIEYLSGHNLKGDVKLRYRRRSTDSWRVFYKQFEWAVDYTVKAEDRPKNSISDLKQIIDGFINQE